MKAYTYGKSVLLGEARSKIFLIVSNGGDYPADSVFADYSSMQGLQCPVPLNGARIAISIEAEVTEIVKICDNKIYS